MGDRMHTGIVGPTTLTASSLTLDLGTAAIIAAAEFRRLKRIHVQATGSSFDGATANFEATLDGSTWFAVTDTDGTVITLTAAGAKAALTAFFGPICGFRVRLSSGSGAESVPVTITYAFGS